LGVERESATGVAQHYGIATDLVDWTWDPLVAVTFAISVSSPGEMASVFIRPFGPSNEPHKAYNVFLPPSLAGRVWRQRGFFSWQPVIPQHFDSPEMRMIDGGYARYRSQASNHYRVSFPVQSEDIDWAKPNLTALYREDFWQLLDLVDWCLDAAATIEYTPRYVGWREGDFITECDRLMLQPPKLFTMPPPDTAIRENVAEMMDYLEMMALRRRPIGGRLAYHKPALQTALVAFPRKSFPMVKVSDAAIRDERAAVLPPNPLRLSRWSEELEKFDPEQDLRAPSDAFFVETRAEQ
jgi:hypothetical protein